MQSSRRAPSTPLAGSSGGAALFVCALLVLLLSGSGCRHAAAPPRAGPSTSMERTELQAFTARFLRAFEDLDKDAFVACFAEDATAFFPLPEPAERFDGRPAITKQFEKVFEAIRAGAPSGPPFHRLEPRELEVQQLGHDAAVVTFVLRNTERFARRTLVLRKVDGQWRIAHLHASTVPLEVQRR